MGLTTLSGSVRVKQSWVEGIFNQQIMTQRQLEIIELRVAEMIERIKRLRSEKMQLQSQIDQREMAFQRLQEERSLVRRRVEKILGKLNEVEGNNGVR